MSPKRLRHAMHPKVARWRLVTRGWQLRSGQACCCICPANRIPASGFALTHNYQWISDTWWRDNQSRSDWFQSWHHPLHTSSIYPCDLLVDAKGSHSLSCRLAFGRAPPHHNLDDTICMAFACKRLNLSHERTRGSFGLSEGERLVTVFILLLGQHNGTPLHIRMQQQRAF